MLRNIDTAASQIVVQGVLINLLVPVLKKIYKGLLLLLQSTYINFCELTFNFLAERVVFTIYRLGLFFHFVTKYRNFIYCKKSISSVVFAHFFDFQPPVPI